MPTAVKYSAKYNSITKDTKCPFGTVSVLRRMLARTYSHKSYRFGFGGHEKDDKVKGNGNHLSFGDYGYDTRLARRWNREPKSAEYPHVSPYSTFEGNPVYFNDKTGNMLWLGNFETTGDRECASVTDLPLENEYDINI